MHTNSNISAKFRVIMAVEFYFVLRHSPLYQTHIAHILTLRVHFSPLTLPAYQSRVSTTTWRVQQERKGQRLKDLFIFRNTFYKQNNRLFSFFPFFGKTLGCTSCMSPITGVFKQFSNSFVLMFA